MLLSSIVTTVCARAGLTADLIDVTQLTDDVIGYQVPRQLPARTVLETLMVAFNFVGCEEDWKIVFKKRSTTSVRTITAAELRAHPAGRQAPDRAVETRTMDVELPTHLTMSYESKVRDYEIATQHAVRVDKAAYVMKSSALGIVLDDTHAKQQVEILLKQMWSGRHKYSFSTTYKHLKLAPGDPVTVNGKLMQVADMADRGGIVDFLCDGLEAGVFSSTATADDLTVGVVDLTTDAYIPPFLAMDLPPLSEDHGSAGLYFALYGPAASFKGGTIQRSTDGGASYADVGFVGATGAVAGACTTTLGNGIEGVLDYTAGVTVDLAASDGVLVDATTDQLAVGDNLAAIGSVAGGWEIIQYRFATLVTGHTYALTGLLRGLRGTARFMASHGAGEKFVKLNSLAGMDFVGANTAALGVSYLYRVRNSAGALGASTAYATGGLTLEPFPAQAVVGGRNAAGDLVLSWARADRYEFLTADLPNGGDIEMNEVTEAYEADVIHSGSGAVLRTLTASTPTVTYTAAQQSADSYPAGAVTFDIYQMSTVVGRGTVRRVSV